MTAANAGIRLLPPSFAPWKPEKARSKQIAVLMSGGVDSSLAAHLLKTDGWDVLGVTMKIPVSCGPRSRGCCGADAALVCNDLSIPHYFVDVTGPFEEFIIEPFRRAYARGQTPSPCVDCNTVLKFSLLWDFLYAVLGIGYLATGHYAKLSAPAGPVRLGRAADTAKDQSYFLYGIPAQKLPFLVLPLGHLTKKQVRSVAARLNLRVAGKAESMELCFAGEGDYRKALLRDSAGQQGDITDMQGNKIGTHQGISNYTLGQRRGVGVACGHPLYVGRIEPATNTIAIGTREQVSFRTIRAEQVNQLIPEQLFTGSRLSAKIRSYGDPKPCKIVDGGAAEMTVEFDEPQFAPCPGQKLVLYDGSDHLVAGGKIASAAFRDCDSCCAHENTC